jgi:hypothetical protein
MLREVMDVGCFAHRESPSRMSLVSSSNEAPLVVSPFFDQWQFVKVQGLSLFT